MASLKATKLCALIYIISMANFVQVSAQQAMQNRTGYPDDIAAARFLGVLDEITRRCPNLEIAPDGEASLLNMGRISRDDVKRSSRLRGAYANGASVIQNQEFDPECAGPLLNMRLPLRVKPGKAAPTGPGWIRGFITPVPVH